MHEQAVLADLRRYLSGVASEHPGARVTGVTIQLGALSHVTEAALRRGWPEVTEGPLAGARLELLQEPALDVPGARELRVVAVTLDEPSNAPSEAPCA